MAHPSAWTIAIRYIARRSRTEAEMRQHLSRKGFALDETDETVGKLRQLDLLDDRKVAKQWLNYCLNNRPVGKKRFVADLMKRGIDRQTIDDIAAALDSETEQKLAEDLLSRRDISSWSQARFFRFLYYRGFSWETAEKLWRKSR